jgi:hypothetical protein
MGFKIPNFTDTAQTATPWETRRECCLSENRLKSGKALNNDRKK